MEKIYCKGCGRRLINTFIGGEKIVEYEDGWYCEKCSKIRQEKRGVK